MQTYFAVPSGIRIRCVAVLAGIVMLACVPAHAAADDIETIRSRLLEMLTGGDDYSPAKPQLRTRLDAMTRRIASNGTTRDPKGTGWWDTLQLKATRTNVLWRDLGRPSFQLSRVKFNLDRITEMARAYAMPHSPLHGNKALAADVVDAIDFLVEQKYNESHPQDGWSNWFDLEIGIPIKLLSSTLLLGDAVPADARERWLRTVAKFVTKPDKIGGQLAEATGANRMWKIRVNLMLAVLQRDAARIAACREASRGLMDEVTEGDGFYADGTFIQHKWFAYNGGYGLALMAEYASLIYALDRTPWAISPAEKAAYAERLESGYLPIVYRGAMFDMMRGREIARGEATTVDAGNAVTRVLIRASLSADPERAARYKALARSWFGEGNFFGRDRVTLDVLWDDTRALRLAEEKSITPAPREPLHRTYQVGAKVVHQQPTWAAGLSMYSRRIAGFESINGENRRGWNTHNGFLAVVLADPATYAGGYWPTVDAYRLPGTTALYGFPTEGRVSRSGFVGGCDLTGGQFGLAAMELAPSDQSLTGRKAWLFTGDEIICLGAGLTSKGEQKVETIIENRRLTTPAAGALYVNGQPLQSKDGVIAVQPAVRSATLVGGQPGDDMGVYFPNPVTLNALRESRTDTWKSINSTSLLMVSDQPVTNRFATLWIDHGAAPTDADYAYVLLPTRTPAQTAQYAARPTAKVIANDDNVQAAESGHCAGAVFWKAGSVVTSLGRMTVSAPCMVAWSRAKDTPEIAVSAPAGVAGSVIEVTTDWNPPAPFLAADPAVKVISQKPLKIALTLPTGGAGIFRVGPASRGSDTKR